MKRKHALMILGKARGKGAVPEPEELLGARQCRAGEGESMPAGTWLTTHQTLTSFLLAPS
eukprot:scaffold30104_cov17-Tisochrysis_lutea.AAC.1